MVVVVAVRIIRDGSVSHCGEKESGGVPNFPPPLNDHKTVPNPTSPRCWQMRRENQNHSVFSSIAMLNLEITLSHRCRTGQLLFRSHIRFGWPTAPRSIRTVHLPFCHGLGPNPSRVQVGTESRVDSRAPSDRYWTDTRFGDEDHRSIRSWEHPGTAFSTSRHHRAPQKNSFTERLYGRLSLIPRWNSARLNSADGA